MACWGRNGGIFIIVTGACPWSYHFPVLPLKLSVLQWNGFPIVR